GDCVCDRGGGAKSCSLDGGPTASGGPCETRACFDGEYPVCWRPLRGAGGGGVGSFRVGGLEDRSSAAGIAGAPIPFSICRRCIIPSSSGSSRVGGRDGTR